MLQFFEFIAQTTQPTLETTVSLTSIAGVIISTTAVVQITKPWLAQASFLKKVPVFAYAIVVSLVLTIIANRVLHTLPGDLYNLMFRTATAAMASSGFYQWVKDGPAGIETTHRDFKAKKWSPTPGQETDSEHFDITPDDLV